MHTLQIEHAIPDFNAWKKAFDSDPARRQQSGVRRYRVLRPVGEPNYVIIDLDFDSAREAEAFRSAMEELWRGAEARGLVKSPRARIAETVEMKEL